MFQMGFLYLIIMAVTYIAGGVIYAVRIPERFFPGNCLHNVKNIVLHSVSFSNSRSFRHCRTESSNTTHSSYCCGVFTFLRNMLFIQHCHENRTMHYANSIKTWCNRFVYIFYIATVVSIYLCIFELRKVLTKKTANPS